MPMKKLNTLYYYLGVLNRYCTVYSVVDLGKVIDFLKCERHISKRKRGQKLTTFIREKKEVISVARHAVERQR